MRVLPWRSLHPPTTWLQFSHAPGLLQPDGLPTMAAPLPAQAPPVQCCVLARAAHTRTTQSGCLGCPSSSSCFLSEQSHDVPGFGSNSSCALQISVSPDGDPTARITPHCSKRQLCLSEHVLQGFPLPAFEISHLLKTPGLFSLIAL